MPYILDTETTGLVAPQPIELAYIKLPENVLDFLNICKDMSLRDFSECLEKYILTCDTFVEQYKPSKPIEPTASKLHGKYLKDLLHCKPVEELVLPDIHYMIGHVISYDYGALGRPSGIKLICTKDLANIVFEKELATKQIPNRKLVTLVHYLYPEEIDFITEHSHSALGDCIMCFVLLANILNKLELPITSWDDLANLCNQPKDKIKNEYEKPVKIMPYGKHRGVPLTDVPLDYLKWLNAQDNLSPALKAGLEQEIAKR